MAALVPLADGAHHAREFGETLGWQAGCFALLLPLAGTLGLLALPDAAMALATLLCVDAGARLLREVDARQRRWSSPLGLALGALSHYRFIAVIGVGLLRLAALARGPARAARCARVDRDRVRRVGVGAAGRVEPRQRRCRPALPVGRTPSVGVPCRRPLVRRDPGLAGHAAAVRGAGAGRLARARPAYCPPSRYFALLGGLVVLGFFGLGFFADTERVSFHWPLPGYLALLPLLPAVLAGWPRWLRVGDLAARRDSAWSCILGYYVARVAARNVRARSRRGEVVSVQLRRLERAGRRRARAARGDAGGHAHRRRQLQDRRRARLRAGRSEYRGARPPAQPQARARAAVAAVGTAERRPRRLGATRRCCWWSATSEVQYKHLLGATTRCAAMVGPLPPPRVLNIDHGRQRFLLFALDPKPRRAHARRRRWRGSIRRCRRCARRPQFELQRLGVQGWRRPGSRRSAARRPRGRAGELRVAIPGPGGVCRKISTDPQHPRVGFDAQVECAARCRAGPALAGPAPAWARRQRRGLAGAADRDYRLTWRGRPVSVGGSRSR